MLDGVQCKTFNTEQYIIGVELFFKVILKDAYLP